MSDEKQVFVLKAEARFMAYDIDHAMSVLALHFSALAANGVDAESYLAPGSKITVHREIEE